MSDKRRHICLLLVLASTHRHMYQRHTGQKERSKALKERAGAEKKHEKQGCRVPWGGIWGHTPWNPGAQVQRKPIPSLVQVPPAWQGWDSQASGARLWLQRGPLHPGSHTQRNLVGEAVRCGRCLESAEEGGGGLGKGLTRWVRHGRLRDCRACGHRDGSQVGRVEVGNQADRGSGSHFPRPRRSHPLRRGWKHTR